MITNVSMPTAAKSVSMKNAPSFGFAKLNDLGRKTADSFEYKQNEFLDGKMFKKQGFFQQSALSKKLSGGEDFANLCVEYGCSMNPETNASFIKNQILNARTAKSVSKTVDADTLAKGLNALYIANYDNPELSLKETRSLLEIAKDAMSPEEYVKHAGILEVGTEKK